MSLAVQRSPCSGRRVAVIAGDRQVSADVTHSSHTQTTRVASDLTRQDDTLTDHTISLLAFDWKLLFLAVILSLVTTLLKHFMPNDVVDCREPVTLSASNRQHTT